MAVTYEMLPLQPEKECLWTGRRSILGLLASTLLIMLSPGNSRADDEPLYVCATAIRSNGEYQWTFKNSCKISVYWTIDCTPGTTICQRDGGRLVLQPNETKSRVLVGIEIGGPRRN